MKISRYIKFPLIFGILIMLYTLFFSFEPSLNKLAISFSVGAVIGILLRIFNDYKVRQTELEAAEEHFLTYQDRSISLACSFDEAFDLCLEALENLKNAKIESADKERRLIKAQTGMNLNSFGNKIQFKLKTITENLTEIKFSTTPAVSTTLIDYGESVKIAKSLIEFFESKNVELNYKQLEGKSVVPVEFAEQNINESVKN